MKIPQILKKLMRLVMKVVKMLLAPFKALSKMFSKMMKSPMGVAFFIGMVVIVLLLVVAMRQSSEGFRTTFAQAAPVNPINNKSESSKF